MADTGEVVDSTMYRTQIVPYDNDYRGGTGDVSNIIYVNDCKPDGCLIMPGAADNAITDTSVIASSISMLSAFDQTQETWDLALDCVREVFAPYDVVITTTDPGSTAHHEAILAGIGTEFGLDDPLILGVAPLTCAGAIDNAISFSFANAMPPGDWLRMCWTVAQESAHAYGLDHVFSCGDPMTYIPGCGVKYFRNKDLICGDFGEQPCFCGGTQQNSHRRLTTLFGEGTLPDPPTLSIVHPMDGETVPDTFVALAEAQDPRQIDRMEVYVNGWLYETIPGNGFFAADDPYIFVPPANLADGVLEIEFIAYNDLELSTSQTITVTKGAPCSSAASCEEGQECNEGACYWPTPTGQLGDSCVRPMDCESLLCPRSEEAEAVQICSQYCAVDSSNSGCPAAYDCLPLRDTPEQGVCWPAPEVSEGCSASGQGGLSTGALALVLLLMGLGWRRRQAHLD